MLHNFSCLGVEHVVVLVRTWGSHGKLPDSAQSLSDGTIPMRCHDPADCPPDFPGCPAYTMTRRSCRSNVECAEGCASATARRHLPRAGAERRLARANRTSPAL